MTFSRSSYTSTGIGKSFPSRGSEGDIVRICVDDKNIVTFATNDCTRTITEFMHAKEELYFVVASTRVGNELSLVD